ncbi:hypothetical protein, partial [Burkholderia ubonensis]|uniref:hypothetical protein n=1 Tax=Burkholderia ubonensis TaxID=101571 RepID=UPI0012FAE018
DAILVDTLEIDTPLHAGDLHRACKSVKTLSAYLTGVTELRLQTGAELQLVTTDSTWGQKTLKLTVVEQGVELRRATWQRDGASHRYAKSEEGGWHYHVEGGQAARIDLPNQGLGLLPGTDHRSLAIEVNLTAATSELVLGPHHGPVNIAQANWAGLTVQWEGESSNLSWRRDGGDLLLLQEGQIKLKWQGLLAAGNEAGPVEFQMKGGASIDLRHYPPQQSIADGVQLGGSAATPEVWLSQADAGVALQQIQDYFAAAPAGMVRIRGHWNGELDLTRRVAWL